MTTTTEKYIKKAVNEAKKEFHSSTISDCSVNMYMEAEECTLELAEALKAQAQANKATSEAMALLAKALKPTEACGIKIAPSENGSLGIFK